MNREALVLYLQQIRNLEVTKVCLTDKFQQVSKSMKEEIQRCQEKSFPEKEDNKEELTIPIILILIALGIFAVSLSLIVQGNTTAFLGICIAFFPLILGIGIIVTTSSARKEKYLQYNAQQQKASEKNEIHIQLLNKKLIRASKQYHKEFEEAENLLSKLYGLNIIPNQYRNLASIYYLYDYMSSSNATLEETLMHEHMENGIQRLEAKMDTMTSVLYDILEETRRISRTLPLLAKQNEQMLASLERNEQNSRLAAQYASLSAYYARTNEYFCHIDITS